MKNYWLNYIRLMRFDKPIGTLLLLWPTFWALWIANEGFPPVNLLIIFSLGVILMRAAGCVINDFADRKIDLYVERTKNRPLTNGEISSKNALILFFVLIVLSFLLLLFLNQFTFFLAFGALFFAVIYPFMKRFTHFPQIFLGIAFSFSIPMSFAASLNYIPFEAYLLFFANIFWIIVYDTEYAMVDRDDDLKIGIKSTAIFFSKYDKLMIGIFQFLTIFLLVLIGFLLKFLLIYYVFLFFASFLFIYQQKLIKYREKSSCFSAFLNNNQVGFFIFLGIFLHYFFW